MHQLKRLLYTSIFAMSFLTLMPVALIASPIKSTFDPLLANEKEQLSEFQLIVKEKKVEDQKWPILQMTRILRATPLTSVAIFLALDHQKEYIPNLIKSMPVRQVSPTEIYTDYEMKLPWPLQNSIYTHASKLSKIDNCYKVSWYSVKSNSANEVKGFAKFCPHEKGTYWEYQNYVNPKSFLAGFFTSSMVKDSTEGVEAISKYIETCQKNRPKIASKYRRYITDALNGKNVYSDLIPKN